MQVGDRAAPAHVMEAVNGELLLRESIHLRGEAAQRRRAVGLAVLETFARLPVSPPQSEGLDLRNGQPASGVRPDFYLRALGEGGKAMLRGYEFERGRGTEHPHWLM